MVENIPYLRYNKVSFVPQLAHCRVCAVLVGHTVGFSTCPCIISHLLEKDERHRDWQRSPTHQTRREFRVLSSRELLATAAAAALPPCSYDRTMSLLLDNQFGELPPDKSVDTELFLEAVSHIPAFFGEYAST